MYTPAANKESDRRTLQEFVHQNSFCTLITQTGQGLLASHIPMILHEDGFGFGTLRGHIARANSQWRDFSCNEEALVIFTGPQHYVSASWYPEKATHGREVPTWNYVAVHVYGYLQAVEDSEWPMEHLRNLTDANEVIAKEPWSVADAPPEFIIKLSRAILGLEMQVSRVEGKWKVSQNRSDRDAAGVMAGLDGVGTHASAAMSELVRVRRPRQA